MNDSELPDDLCPQPAAADTENSMPTWPMGPAIWPTSVWACDSPQQARDVLSGSIDGYAYQRDGHPNADQLALKCRMLHRADHAAITSSGVAAMSLAVLSQLQQGDHIIVSRQLYGRSLQLLGPEVARLGIDSTQVDVTDINAVERACTDRTRLLVVETIANPMLEVADITALAELAHRRMALLLVDNSFATPIVCRPMEFGADLVVESISKMMNGHSDVILGLLCGTQEVWSRVSFVSSAWGFAGSPFDCWLAQRGLTTLALRADRASENALQIASALSKDPRIDRVHYPGLPDHPQHAIAARQFGGRFGSIVTFHLRGDEAFASRWIQRVGRDIPFAPSLGEVSTTLSHPASTSHRAFDANQLDEAGIRPGTIRLSVGIESAESILHALTRSLDSHG